MKFSKQYMLWETFLHKHFFLPEHPLVWIGLYILQYFLRQKSVLYLVKLKFSVFLKKNLLRILISYKGFRVSLRSHFEVIFLRWFKWNILKVSFGTGVRFQWTFCFAEVYESKPKITPQVSQKMTSAAHHVNSSNKAWRQPAEYKLRDCSSY